MGWKKIKIGEFLFERKGLIEPNSKELFSFGKIEKIDFSEGKIFLRNYSPTKTKQIIVKNGDFVFSGLNIEKGAVAINDSGQDLVVSANYSTCEVDYSKIDREFLKIFIKSPSFKKLLTDNLKKDYGFTRPKHLKNLEVALPSIEEQRKIAEKLKVYKEKQKQLQQQIENQKTYLKNLRKQILQDAVEGKLTKEWREKNPDVESASELLKKIKKEKEKLIAKKKIKKEKPLPPIEESEISFELPKNWVWTRLGEVINIKSGNSYDYTSSNKGVLYVKVGDMNLPDNCSEIVTSSSFFKDINIKEGDLIPTNSIIFPKRGGAIATNKKRKVLKESILVDSNTMAIVIPRLLNIEFIFRWFQTVDISKFGNDSVIPQVNNKDIWPIRIPLPPLLEQQAIVSKLETLMQKLDEAEKQIEKSLETSKLLTKAILMEAFNKKFD